MRRPRIATFGKKLGLLAGSLVVGLAVAELVLRSAGISYPLPYAPDPFCGTRLQPGFAAWFTKEGRAYVTINRDGYRDREHARRKPPGTFRIAVLGDSYAEAMQVPLEQTFWSVMQRRLQACKAFRGQTVEVLNFGVSGYGTAQELLMLRHYVWPYEPDLVLLAFLTGNDVSDNCKTLRPNAARPYFRLEGDQLVLDASFRNHPDYRKARSWWTKMKVALINRARVLQAAAEARNRWRQRAAQRAVHTASRRSGLDATIYAEPQTPGWNEAWQITERLIAQMGREVRAHGAAFWVATLTNDIQVNPDPAVRRAYAKTLGVADLFYPDRRIARLGQREGFPVVLLAPAMQAYAEQHHVYLHGFRNTQLGAGHWNAEGHRLAGQLIAAAICASR